MPVPTQSERDGYDVLTYPDGSIDTLRVPVNPLIAPILARYPLPNYPTGAFGARTYATASKVDTDANQFSLRLDHKFSSKDQFFARVNFNDLTGPPPIQIRLPSTRPLVFNTSTGSGMWSALTLAPSLPAWCLYH